MAVLWVFVNLYVIDVECFLLNWKTTDVYIRYRTSAPTEKIGSQFLALPIVYQFHEKITDGIVRNLVCSVRTIQGKLDRSDPVLISLSSSVVQYRSSTLHAESAERPVC